VAAKRKRTITTFGQLFESLAGGGLPAAVSPGTVTLSFAEVYSISLSYVDVTSLNLAFAEVYTITISET
jgi:hypothetical protein